MKKKINKKDFVPAKMHLTLTPGKMLKILRELQNLTQLELAEKTGIPQAHISALENETRQLGRERALVLARALKTHPAVLLFPDYDVNAAA